MADILFLAHRAPWPPDRGDRIRSWHMFEALARLGDVHVAALVDSETDREVAAEKMAPLCKSLRLEVRRAGRVGAMLRALRRGEPASVAAFYSVPLALHVGGLLRHGDISHIVGFSGQMAQYLPAPDQFSGPVVMDFVDVDSAKFAAFAAGNDEGAVMRRVYAREARLLAAYEADVAQRVDASLFVSAAEAALFRTRSGLDDTVHALENGIDTARFDPTGIAPVAAGDGPLIVFTGQMDYRPNIDAVGWFARDILPLVRAERPDAHFAIVGRAPTDTVRALAQLPGVIVTGEVDDVRPWLAAADVVAAPLLLARGVQNKLLEAMAMARPVVASSAAAEGIDAVAGEHLCVADGAQAMAEAVLALLAGPAGAAKMGAAARVRMVARYGWEARLAPLAGLLGLAE